jgi:hypothetical protein
MGIRLDHPVQPRLRPTAASHPLTTAKTAQTEDHGEPDRQVGR